MAVKSGTLARSIRRAARAARAAKPLPTGGTVVMRYGTVTAVTSTTVTVTVGSDSLTAPYLAAYSPRTVGDIVRVDFADGSPIVVDRVVGVTAE